MGLDFYCQIYEQFGRGFFAPERGNLFANSFAFDLRPGRGDFFGGFFSTLSFFFCTLACSL